MTAADGGTEGDELSLRASLARLKLWAIGLAVALLVLLEAFDYTVLEPNLPSATAHALSVFLMVGGVIGFSAAMWRILEAAERRVRSAAETARHRALQLEALHEAALDMASDLDLGTVLQRVVDSCRRIAGTHYGALAVLGPGGVIDGFFTSGIDRAARAALGPPPVGHGLIGVVLADGEVLRVDNIQADPRSSGFPPGHPPMRTLLATPLRWQSRTIGSLYLTDREDGQPFSADDEAVLLRFAANAAAAIANARLYDQVQRLAVVEERERIAMDLHDGVIQSLYGASLTLDSIATKMDGSREGEALNGLVDRIQGVIGDIRHYIFDLRRAHAAEQPLSGTLRRLLADTGAPGFTKVLDIPEQLGPVPEAAASHLWHVAHEALANAVRHSGGSRVTLGAREEGGAIVVWVEDDGQGFEPEAARAGHGVDHMRRRMEALGGELSVGPGQHSGTRVTARLPIKVKGEVQ